MKIRKEHKKWLFMQPQQVCKCIAACWRLGFRKTLFGLAPSAMFCSSTFFCARKNASHFSLSGAKKRQLQPERYVPFLLNCLDRLTKNIKYGIKIK